MAMAKDAKISGVEKAAILLMNLGEELAGEVCKHLTPTELQQLSVTMAKKSVAPEQGRHVVSEFAKVVGSGTVEGPEFAKKLVLKTLGPDKGQFILDQISTEAAGGTIESIKWKDPALLANTLRYEHPQIIALILAHLDPDRAAQVLLHIPEERVRGEVMLRIASLKTIPQAAVRDLEKLLSERILSADTGRASNVEGVKVAAEILNQVESKLEGYIMDIIEKASPDLAVKIQEKMFIFTDLLGVDDKGMQQIIKELSTDIVTLALKGSDDSMKEKFFKNMSERAAEMLKEDIENKGPVKVSDVEKAQQEIIKVARRLEQEGKIIRGGGKGGDVIV